MKKDPISTKELRRSGNARGAAAHERGDQHNSRRISDERLDLIFADVGQKLREGHSSLAEKLLTTTIAGYAHTPDHFANLKRLLSFTLETAGRYSESLDAVKPFEDEENLANLSIETQVRVITQLAIAYNNRNEQPKAVTLLKETLKRAENNNLRHLSGAIDIALARVYRKLNEYPISRDYAQKALEHFRENGNWLGMAEAYREIANSHHQEGNSEKAVANFQLGIKIIGGNSAPFMLGKLYTDMSGAYWFLRRPQDGIACLEKSIEFFDQTEHALNTVIAYNNLGINLMLIGELAKAEEMIKRALDIALKENHVHVAGIYDSLGELNILRGNLDEAEEYLDKAVQFAEERNHQWYRVQSMRNLARCYLAQGNEKRAAAMAREVIDRSAEIGDRHYAKMSGLVLAESYLRMGSLDECENSLLVIEADDPSSDFFVLGNIQRIRGLVALETGDTELAIHHFSRSLTIFEAAEDLYHTGLVHLLLGANLDRRQAKRAKRHLNSAADIFKKLGDIAHARAVAKELGKIESTSKSDLPAAERRSNSVVSQLLMVRLAEATATRELLFRELVAVLQQESNAKKLLIAQYTDKNRLYPFITHGYSPQESNELVAKFSDAHNAKDDKSFSRSKNVAVFPLRGTAAEPAFLLINPQSGAVLNDDSSLQPLLRVVELGMDVIALREKDKSAPTERDANLHTSNSLMPGFIHSSPAMTALVEEVYKIRSSDVTVLVTGESGTGKELVSRAIHTLSNRKDKIFVPFNCTAVPKELAEGHLFGYKKGAFTGAVQDSPGVIRTADGGTLFLDEVGDLPIDVQPKLLRFLQEGEIQPLGDKQPMKVDVRIIAATNMPLEEKVAEGTFREDLYYRLNVIRLRVPPLRERRAEIPPIINYYVNHYSSRFSKHNVTFTPQTIDLLMVCNWQGNVRQLCNEIQRIVARAVDNEVITPDHLSPELKRSAQPLTPFDLDSNVKPIASYDGVFSPFANISEGGTLEEAVSELEMQLIKASLARHNWNISRVAGELGLTRRGLYLKLTRYGIAKAA
ncbi:MAG: sigma 54-interacting transcriptional regulator [Pyrinomonadaceae bacterium]|nr:sigma 54-interacting transcriptional regulator [Pyrinomonadaceae bacterium]MBP6214286.1 sigma 54-interacting transcriptional regulator [Pyrinomonadaceae bacterium]